MEFRVQLWRGGYSRGLEREGKRNERKEADEGGGV